MQRSMHISARPWCQFSESKGPGNAIAAGKHSHARSTNNPGRCTPGHPPLRRASAATISMEASTVSRNTKGARSSAILLWSICKAGIRVVLRLSAWQARTPAHYCALCSQDGNGIRCGAASPPSRSPGCLPGLSAACCRSPGWCRPAPAARGSARWPAAAVRVGCVGRGQE